MLTDGGNDDRGNQEFDGICTSPQKAPPPSGLPVTEPELKLMVRFLRKMKEFALTPKPLLIKHAFSFIPRLVPKDAHREARGILLEFLNRPVSTRP